MRTGQWKQIEALFNEAIGLQGDARRSFLDLACGGDQELRGEVESLLLASDQGDVALERVKSAFAAYTAPAARSAGQRVGAYLLIREIGQGGMGAVFLAERADDQFRKHVAIKFVRGVPSADLLRRFKSERQILATLDHPNVARLLDGGVTDAGEPYVVMEYVDGKPIDAYCKDKPLETGARLRLFRDVCSAVQAAHRRLIVHRDIKPLNILVAADGTVKLLDFGIAKLLDDPEGPSATQTSARLLTPDYASPEQVRGDPITTASDIYSLGVLLYKLLTGEKPYKIDARNPADIARAITLDAPDPPSRATTSRLLRRELAGDLDTIVLKAMRKEPDQRYATVEQFADDITRYLDGLPVLARPTTRGYRVRKFVSRHRFEVGAAAAVLLLVIALTTVYTVRLARERDFARQEQRTAQQVTAFVERLFRISNPSETRGRNVTALEVLDSAAARMPRELTTEPQVKAAMLYTLGTVYKNLGRDSTAKRIIEDGLRLRDSIGGRSSPATGEFFSLLGDLTLNLGQFDSAAALFRSALDRLGGEYGPLDYRMFEARMGLGNSFTRAGHYAAADSVLAANVAAARTLPSDTGGILVHQLNALGALRLNQRRADEAVPIVKEAWEGARDRWGEHSPSALINLSNLAFAYRLQSRFGEAESISREVLRLFRRVYGDNHANTATAWNNLALIANALGKDAEAEQAAREALNVYRALYGNEHQRVALATGNVATMLGAQRKFAESERMHREAIAMREKILIPGHVEISTGYSQLGQVLQLQGKFVDAERSYRRALDVVTKGAGVESADAATYQTNLGSLLLATGRTAESERVLRVALGTQRQKLPAVHASTAATLTTLGMLLTQTARASDAEPLLGEALRIRTAVFDSTHWAIQETRSAYGDCLAALGRPAEAEPLLTSSADALLRRFGPTDRRAGAAVDRVARYFASRGDSTRAAHYRGQVDAR